MGKRGNGEGSIGRRKSGGWYAQYTVYTSEGRKRRTLYGKTRQEVATKLSKALADREGGLTFDAGSLTVGEYMTRWLSHSVQDTVSQKTYERYESIVRVHLSPALGRIRLKALTSDHVRGLYREKLDSGLAPRTVLHIHRTLSKALKQATDDGLIPRNAAASVKPPQARREEMQPLSRDQVRMFLDTVKGTEWRPSTYWLSPPACGRASSWPLSGKTWILKARIPRSKFAVACRRHAAAAAS
jgi:integrase